MFELRAGNVVIKIRYKPCAWTTIEGEDMPSWSVSYPTEDGQTDTDQFGLGNHGLESTAQRPISPNQNGLKIY